MAMVECIECGQQISDRAEFCPHCGRPTSRRQKPVKYMLRMGSAGTNGYASFLHGLAIVVAIAGLILAITGSNTEVAYGYSSRRVFSWSTFFISVISYALYTFVLWSVGTVIQMIQETHDMVAGLKLEREEETKRNAPVSTPRYVEGIFEKLSHQDNAQEMLDLLERLDLDLEAEPYLCSAFLRKAPMG